MQNQSPTSMLNTYRQAAHVSGRSLSALLIEAARLRLGPQRLGISEYIDFQLYQNDLDWPAKTAFGGLRAQQVLEDILVDDYSRFLSQDKLSMYALMQGFGLPIPRLRAMYRTLRPSSVLQLPTPQALAAYLRDAAHLPVYLKRAFGSYGRGNALVTAVDGDQVVLGNGQKESLDDFCASLDDGRGLGWILQDPLQAHGEIAALTRSSKISGLRVHSFRTPGGVQITKAIFKVNAGLRDSDNFEHGASGNLLGAVDIETGRVTRAIAGVGFDQQVNPSHPLTQAPLLGFSVPNWAEVKKLVTDAHTAFPGFLCPGWDIALCADGPKILEINAFGDIDLSQHAYRRGFLDETLRALMNERGLLPLLSVGPGQNERSPINHRLGKRRHHWPW